MAYRVLEVTIQSAKDLKRVNLLSRMEVYAVVTISGDPLTRQCTPPDPYGGRHPCWNATFRFNVPPSAAAASSANAGGCLHVLLRTERSLGDRDVGEVIVPLADILAGANDPGPRPQQFAAYTVRKVHRCEPRGTLNVSYRLGPVVAPQQVAPARGHDSGHLVAYPMAQPPFYHPSAVPYGGYLPPTMSLPPPGTHQAYNTGGHHDAVHQHHPQSVGPTNAYNNSYPAAAAAAYSSSQAPTTGGHGAAAHQQPAAQSAGPVNNAYSNNNSPAYYPQQAAAAGYAASPAKKGGSNKSGEHGNTVDFGVGLGAGLVSGAIGGMLASDMMAEAAAYSYGYRAGLADGGGAAAAMYKYKNSHHVLPNKVQDKVEPKRTTTTV